MLGIDLALLIGGAVVTETVFNIPGLGNYILVSADTGDLPAVLAVVVIAGVLRRDHALSSTSRTPTSIRGSALR